MCGVVISVVKFEILFCEKKDKMIKEKSFDKWIRK